MALSNIFCKSVLYKRIKMAKLDGGIKWPRTFHLVEGFCI